ncbi:hypothetical protein [Pseudoxanthomonas sp. 10H]|uniref:hypothetical protein n=1 Tax=Pseudoxanthomonas sp. 10H TaxID=3242729 RepID=UPI003557F260
MTPTARPVTTALRQGGEALLFLSPDTVGTSCGLSAAELALLAGLARDTADDEPWHPRLQALLRDLVELFSLLRTARPHEAGSAFWAAHRAVRRLDGRTLVEAVADGDWDAVHACLQAAPAPR